jgi:hypothetical protein
MRSMRPCAQVGLSTVLLLASTFFAAGQSAAPQADPADKPPAEISFHFERPGLPVPQFSIKLRENGAARYEAEQAERPSTATAMRGEAAQHIDRTLMLSQVTATKIFKTARELKDFNIECATKLKNIADTGKKTLTYAGPDGNGSCSYNYSENKNVAMLTDTFLGIAFTLDEGRRLEFLHRYDRLGLDAEMISLSEEVDAGRALELGTISQTLTALAGDMAVLERVRQRAMKLLDQANIQ